MPIDFGIKDFIDIFLVALLLFYCYKVMKESRSLNIFFGVLIFIVFWLFISQVMEMRLLGSVLDKLVSVGALALIILFQEEIRNFFFTLGTHHKVESFLKWIRRGKKNEKQTNKDEMMPIVMACLNMSKQKTGALIVIERTLPLNDVIRSGELLDANINQRLIENIFFKNSPLHDGALIISKNRIKAAGCILPVSHSMDIPKELGLRHRAAKGISQETDALAVIVSEETGNISVAYKDVFHLRLSAEELERFLTEERS
ncbi:MAG: diadenylate cyclase CdaA [Paraprevotella sp.]|nr:diadenylate cyclase CdaA [Paraprevotella sp.]MBQ8283320.1 diadenylate cyclase CdaA [Paraprevotella sp.]